MSNKVAKAAAVAARREQAWRLKLAGYSYPKIGQMLGVSAVQAWKYVRAEADLLNERSLGTAERWRRVVLARLETAINALWPAVLAGDTGAIALLVKITERQAKLLGLDAPQRVDITARLLAWAEAQGLDKAEVLRQAEAVLKELQAC